MKDERRETSVSRAQRISRHVCRAVPRRRSTSTCPRGAMALRMHCRSFIVVPHRGIWSLPFGWPPRLACGRDRSNGGNHRADVFRQRTISAFASLVRQQQRRRDTQQFPRCIFVQAILKKPAPPMPAEAGQIRRTRKEGTPAGWEDMRSGRFLLLALRRTLPGDASSGETADVLPADTCLAPPDTVTAERILAQLYHLQPDAPKDHAGMLEVTCSMPGVLPPDNH